MIFFFLQKHRETELKSGFIPNDLLQNVNKPRIMLKKVWYFSIAKKKLFALKSGHNFCSGSPGVLQYFKNWLETVVVTREFSNYPVKLKLWWYSHHWTFAGVFTVSILFASDTIDQFSFDLFYIAESQKTFWIMSHYTHHG